MKRLHRLHHFNRDYYWFPAYARVYFAISLFLRHFWQTLRWWRSMEIRFSFFWSRFGWTQTNLILMSSIFIIYRNEFLSNNIPLKIFTNKIVEKWREIRSHCLCILSVRVCITYMNFQIIERKWMSSTWKSTFFLLTGKESFSVLFNISGVHFLDLFVRF